MKKLSEKKLENIIKNVVLIAATLIAMSLFMHNDFMPEGIYPDVTFVFITRAIRIAGTGLTIFLLYLSLRDLLSCFWRSDDESR